MGNEMGNNNTSAIKEEDNISEGDKNNLLEDTKDANVISQDVHADGVNEKDTSLAKDVMENSSYDFNDISEVKGEIQTIPTEEAKDAKEQARLFASSNITNIPENDSLEGGIYPSDKNIENEMHPPAEAEDFQEKAKGMASQVTKAELGEVPLQEEILGDDVKEEIQMIPTAEATDIEEKATGLISNNIESMIENDSLERDTHESEMNMKNQVHPIAEAEDVEEKATAGMASDDPLNLTKSFDGEEMSGARQSEKLPYVESLESENSESLSNSSMEGTEECRKQEDSCLSKNLSLTDNHDLNDESSIKHAVEEDTMVLTLNAVTTSNDSEVKEPPSVHHDELVKSLCEDSFQGTDNISEGDKKNLLEDISEHANVITQDVHADSIKEKNHNNIPTFLTKDVMEKSSNDLNDITIQLGKDTSQENDHADDVKEEIQTILAAEAKDAKAKATLFASSNTTSMLQNDSMEGYTSEMNMENQVHPVAEAEDIDEKAKGMTSDHIENELLKGKDNEEIAARLSYDDETSKLKGNPQEDKQDGDVIIPITKETDDQGKTTILASDDPLNLIKPFGDEGEEIIGVMQSEKSPYAGSFGSESYESLSSSSLEGTEACRKHDEEETMVLTLNAVTTSNDSELQEPPSLHHDELVTSLSEHSFHGTESLIRDSLLDANSHGIFEKDMESQEKLLSANNGNMSTNVNYITKDSLNPFPEENKLSRCGSKKENPKDYKPDQCMKEIKEKKSDMVNNTYDMAIGSNGDYNVERHTALDSSVFEISNSDQVEEPKVTENGLQLDSSVFQIAKSDQVEEPKVIENGLQLDAYVNNSNKASDESSAGPEQNYYVVPEAETVTLIADTNENPESSYAMVNDFEETDVSDQCNSFLETINQEEYFSLQNSTSLNQTNESKYFDLTVENREFSKLTIPSIDLVDEEAEATSLIVEELTNSEATISTGTCSNNSILANNGYETRLSIESNSDNPNISCQIQKSPSFNLDLRIEAWKEESDQTPLLYQEDIKSVNESLSKQSGLNISNSMPHAHSEYDQFMLQSVEMPVEEKIVTMERSYSEISKAPFTSILKDEEEAHLLVMAQTQDNHGGTNKQVKEVSSTSHEGKEKRKSRSYFFSSCVCCATVTN